MARSTRDNALEGRTNRARLKAGKRHWRTIGKGLALGYRRGANGGTWYMRRALPDEANQYAMLGIGSADDSLDADGVKVLTYFEAQDKVRALVKQQAVTRNRYTVADAMKDYLAWAATNTKAHESARRAVDAHILPKLGEKRVTELTTAELRQWHQALAAAAPRLRGKKGVPKLRKIDRSDPEAVRARKATANRILTILKAALTQAYDDERVPSDAAWRRVKPFKNADAAKIRYLTADEGRRLANAATKDFRPLVRAALLTGTRWGELTALKAGDFNADADTIHIRESKSGKPRYVPLNDEGIEFFTSHTVGLAANDLMFSKEDGRAWGKSHQHRPMRDACKGAKIEPPCSFHDLRNTYGALLAMAGTPVQVISALLGHSDTRVTEKHYAHLSPSHVAETLRNNLPAFNAKPKAKVNAKPKARAKRGNVVAIRR